MSLEGHASAEEESDQGKDHLFAELFVEEEHAQHDPDRHYAQYRHCPLDDLQHRPKLLDVGRESINKVTGEAIGPEAILALAKGHLQLDILLLMAISVEEVEGVLEGGRATLDAVVHPRSAKLLFVERDGGGLTTNDGHALDDGDFILVRVLGEGVCAGLLERLVWM